MSEGAGPLLFGKAKLLQLHIDELAELFVLDQPVHHLVGATAVKVSFDHLLGCCLIQRQLPVCSKD